MQLERIPTDSDLDEYGHGIVVDERAHRPDNTVSPDVKQVQDHVRYSDLEQDKRVKLRTRIEDLTHLVYLQIAKVQFGVWYNSSNSPGTERSFSVEYERKVVRRGAAYLSVVHEHKHIRIEIGEREKEETNTLILVKFSSIRKLGLGQDESGQTFIVFDLYAPPNFKQETYKQRTKRKGKYKTRELISAIDDSHASIAPYAHHLRLVLADPDDLPQFEKICHVVECEPRPIRIPSMDVHTKRFFSPHNLSHVQRWLKTMDWKSAFQIEAYLRCGLLNTRDLLNTLQKPIEDAIKHYGAESNDFLRLFAVALKTRQADEDPKDCLKRIRSTHGIIRPLRLAPGHISCHHVIITPSRILLEGPYTTQSNRVIRHYQDHDPTLAERFIRVEFRDEDRLAFRLSGDAEGLSFLQRRVGGILRHGFELGGRAFEFLAYSTSSLREHSVWFVSPFRDPVEGYVNAEKIRSSLGDFSRLLRTPSKYAARIAQAFTTTDRSVKIRRDQWEEQPDLGPHTDGVGTISPELAHMVWDERCKANRNLKKYCVEPSAYQFRFLGYKGVVVVDHRLEGIKMRLRKSQCKFPVNEVEEAELDIARSFNYPNPVHLNRPVVMALEDRGVESDTFMDLQEKAKANICLSAGSLENFSELLKIHGLGDRFHLVSILEQLVKLGLDFKDSTGRMSIKSTFFERLLRSSIHHCLREVKFKARIPVPDSYQLVGVADEGRAYIQEGVDEDRVFTLKPGTIYVCVQTFEGEEPIHLKGTCVISRSPVIHPGDVQRVFAVGKPPEDKICFFRGLKNVVVLPAVGERSLASCLAGGDLDGDTYDIYYANPGLLPSFQIQPADYPSSAPWTLEEGREDATVDDICDFIVEYINSDVLGLLADRHIVIADQSKDGVFDSRCMKLAQVFSQALDYAKNGIPVDIRNNLPRPSIKSKPDWHRAEVTGARELDYYVSDRALGHLFRNVELRDPSEPIEGLPTDVSGGTAPLEDAITCAVEPLILRALNTTRSKDDDDTDKSCADYREAKRLHAHFAREMQFICTAHTLVDSPDVRLTEEEVVLGVILANCTQSRWRVDRTCRMKLHSGDLVGDIYEQVTQFDGPQTEGQLRAALARAWDAWCWAQYHRDRDFIESFALLVLGIVLDCLRRLGALPEI